MLYPLAVDLTDKCVLVVGGGQVALRKIEHLINYNCVVVIVSPILCDELKKIIDHYLTVQETENAPNARLRWDKQWYQFEALESIQPHLVLTCTDDEAVNKRIVEHCKRLGIWVNSATHGDYPGDCITPASFEAADNNIQVALWSNQNLPILTHFLKQKMKHYLEKEFGSKLTNAIRLLSNFKKHLKLTEPNQEKRKELQHKVFNDTQFWTWAESETYQENPKALLDKLLSKSK